MEWIIFFLVIILLAILIASPFLYLRRKTIGTFVNRWVKENDFQLIKYEERAFSPFTFSLSLKKSRSQEVVLAEVKNKQGKHRKCWLILGGYFSGLFRYEVTCKWVD